VCSGVLFGFIPRAMADGLEFYGTKFVQICVFAFGAQDSTSIVREPRDVFFRPSSMFCPVT
jgi:hypothetical protein